MSQLDFSKKSLRGDVWDDLERQEARRDDHAQQSGLLLRSSSPGLLSQTFTEDLSVLQSHSCGPVQGSWCFIQDFVEINLGKKVSELCSNWIACNREVPWACLQCHPVGTGRALLVLLGNAPGKTPFPAMLRWEASDAINHHAQEMKPLRKTWANLHLVLVNKIHGLEE